MTTIIFSLGQLISSNVQTLKNAFQSALAEEGKNNSGDEVWKWMAGYLPKLRLDQITLNDLCSEFNTHFSAAMSINNFTNCFNSMCNIDEASIAQVTKLNDFLYEHPEINFVVVSHTNFSQLNHIMAQLEQVIPDCRTGIITDTTSGEQDAKVLFATSMYSQCEQHPDTLQWAINKLEIDLDKPVISFLNTIQELERANNFTYIPADAILDAEKVIDALNTLHRPSAKFSS